MYELIQVTERSCYIQCPAKIGLVRLEGDRVCLIDSGSDKDAGRKVRQILDANGWRLTAIYNTHSNADHIGGNQYLQKQTGCRIFAPGVERDFTQHTVPGAVLFIRGLSLSGASAQVSDGPGERCRGADARLSSGGFYGHRPPRTLL